MPYPKMDVESSFKPFQPNASQVSNTSHASQRSRGLHLTSVHTIKTNSKAKQDLFELQLGRIQPSNIHSSDPANFQPDQNLKSIFFSDQRVGPKSRQVIPIPSDYQSTFGQRNWHLCDCRQNEYLKQCSSICVSCLDHLQYECLDGQCCSRCVEHKAILMEPQKTIQKAPVYEEADQEDIEKLFNQSTGIESSPLRPRPQSSIKSSSIPEKGPVKKQKKSINICYCKLKGCFNNLCTCKQVGLKCSARCQCGPQCHNWEGAPDCQGCQICTNSQTKKTYMVQTSGFYVDMETNIFKQIAGFVMKHCTESISIETEFKAESLYEVANKKKTVKGFGSIGEPEVKMGSQSDSRSERTESGQSVKCEPVDLLKPLKYKDMDME